jgi:diguanylate cyclase (GGDEF)-like protein/PAS domain S-box-containing protein
MEEIYKQIFENSLEPQFILEKSTWKIQEVNKLFETLSGYARNELIGMPLLNLVGDNHLRSTFESAQEPLKTEVKLRTRNGQLIPVELKMVSITGERTVGFLRDLTEKRLYVESAWEKIEEIIKSNSRLGIIKEKLEAMQELARDLLDLKSLDQVFERAAAFMQKRDKLGYEKVLFYLCNENNLIPTAGAARTKTKSPELADLISGKVPFLEKGTQIITSLKGKEGTIGIMEVKLPKRELESLSGNEIALKGYREIVIAIAEIIGLILENIKLYERIFEQSIIDPLTNLFNRRYLDAKLEEEISRSTRYNRPLSIVMADVNGFKEINDTYGHKQGDYTLQEMAGVIRESSRKTDIVARYGGDEFIILMPETNLENATVKGQHLAQSIAASKFSNIYVKNEPMHLTVAIGISQYTPGATADDFLRNVDKAMYQDKQKFYDIIKGAG